MNEVERMVGEILHEMYDMSPKEIEELRVEWMAAMKERNPKSYEKVAHFIDSVCDVAINRAKRKQEIA